MDQVAAKRNCAQLVEAVRKRSIRVLKIVKAEDVLRKRASEAVRNPEGAFLNWSLSPAEIEGTQSKAEIQAGRWRKSIPELMPMIESLYVWCPELGHLKDLFLDVPTEKPAVAFPLNGTKAAKVLTRLLQLLEKGSVSLATPIERKPSQSYSRTDRYRYEHIGPEKFKIYTNKELWVEFRSWEEKNSPGITHAGFRASLIRIRRFHGFDSSSDIAKKSD